MERKQLDIWAQWLLHRRHTGDAEQLQASLEYLYPVRDKVLEHARLDEGDVLLDVGCGDGLIAFGALQQGQTAQVVFSDISEDLLDHCRSIAQEMGVTDRCQFLQASAEDLSVLGDASVDAVTTRSVLIYVPNKEQAFREFYRVLTPGGRLSIFEPINRFAFPEPPEVFAGYDVSAVQELAAKVKTVYERVQPPNTDPMLDFDERDLIRFAQGAGFSETHLELRADIEPQDEEDQMRWEIFLKRAGNPKVPTVEEAIEEALTPEEAERFTSHLRPLVESSQGVNKMAVAYLWAVK